MSTPGTFPFELHFAPASGQYPAEFYLLPVDAVPSDGVIVEGPCRVQLIDIEASVREQYVIELCLRGLNNLLTKGGHFYYRSLRQLVWDGKDGLKVLHQRTPTETLSLKALIRQR